MCVQLSHALSYKETVEPGYVYIFIFSSIWIPYAQFCVLSLCLECVLHFMLTNLHFACVQTVRGCVSASLQHATIERFRVFLFFAPTRSSTLVTVS